MTQNKHPKTTKISKFNYTDEKIPAKKRLESILNVKDTVGESFKRPTNMIMTWCVCALIFFPVHSLNIFFRPTWAFYRPNTENKRAATKRAETYEKNRASVWNGWRRSENGVLRNIFALRPFCFGRCIMEMIYIRC